MKIKIIVKIFVQRDKRGKWQTKTSNLMAMSEIFICYRSRHFWPQIWADLGIFFVIWLWLWYRGVFLCISFMQMKASLINVLQVHNEVATLTAGTMLMIEKTTPHAPSNVTVTRKETFAVTIEWLPGYSGCSHCEQTYKIRWESTKNR